MPDQKPMTSQVPTVRKLEQERVPANPDADSTDRPIRASARRTHAAALARSLRARRKRQ